MVEAGGIEITAREALPRFAGGLDEFWTSFHKMLSMSIFP